MADNQKTFTKQFLYYSFLVLCLLVLLGFLYFLGTSSFKWTPSEFKRSLTPAEKPMIAVSQPKMSQKWFFGVINKQYEEKNK